MVQSPFDTPDFIFTPTVPGFYQVDLNVYDGIFSGAPLVGSSIHGIMVFADYDGDGVPDYQQGNVVAGPIADGPNAGQLIVLETPASTSLSAVASLPIPTNVPNGVGFPLGLLSFEVNVAMSGGSTTAVITYPPGIMVNAYYKYGFEPGNPAGPHWYDFAYDGSTGAVVNAFTNTVTLYFVDGARGDNDLTFNGMIVDPGAPSLDDNFSLLSGIPSRIEELRSRMCPVDQRGKQSKKSKSSKKASSKSKKSNDVSKELEDALKYVNRGLERWLDPTHTDSRHGKNMFDDLKEAVERLEKVAKYSSDCEADAQGIIDDLLVASLKISTNALAEAVAACYDSNCSKELERASKELDKYQKVIAKGHAGHAIDKLKKVWEHSRKAVKHISGRMTEAGLLDAATVNEMPEVPESFDLEANYPNPFNPQTTIRFSVPETADVRLDVFDMLGRRVRVLVDGTVSAGIHDAIFEARELPSGVYLYRLTTPKGSFTETMLLLK